MSIMKLKHICAIHVHSFEAYQDFRILSLAIFLKIFIKPDVHCIEEEIQGVNQV